jgi:3-isopropylmalate/(R)-2-methylmalate dehydratase small subunit
MTSITGHVWIFGDRMDTDLLMPMAALERPREEQPPYVFSANRPGWSALVEAGDVIIAGSGFGIGSSRPAARVLLDLGISAVVATSFNGLFLRNAATAGLPCLTITGLNEQIAEGEEVTVDLDRWVLTAAASGQTYEAEPLPTMLRELMSGGGLVPTLVAQGYIEG